MSLSALPEWQRTKKARPHEGAVRRLRTAPRTLRIPGHLRAAALCFLREFDIVFSVRCLKRFTWANLLRTLV